MNDTSKGIGKNKIVWLLISVAIAVLTIRAVSLEMHDFSLKSLGEYLRDISPVFVIFIVMAVAGFVFFEGLAISVMGREFGYRVPIGRGIVYAASDIYFSAITPSATGGQPACAYIMVKDGLPISFTTMILVVNLIMYTASLTITGIVTIILCPQIFFRFSIYSRVLIAVGCIIQILLIFFFIALLFNEKLLENLLFKLVGLLVRIKIIRRPQKYLDKYSKLLSEYKECTLSLKHKNGLLAKAFLCNMGQRISQMIVPALVYMGTSGDIKIALHIWFVQTLVVVGSYVIPIPGAIGVTDYLMIDGFADIIASEQAFGLEMVSRGLSFYVCILVCAVITFVKYMMIKKRSV